MLFRCLQQTQEYSAKTSTYQVKQVYQPLQDIYKMMIMSEKTKKMNLWEIKYI